MNAHNRFPVLFSLGAIAALGFSLSSASAQTIRVMPKAVTSADVYNAPTGGDRYMPRAPEKNESLGMWQAREAGVRAVPTGTVSIGGLTTVEEGPVVWQQQPRVLVTSGGSAAIALSGDQVASRIRNASPDQREAVIAEVDARIAASTTALSTMRKRFVSDDQLKPLNDDLTSKTRSLTRGLNAARQATGTEWESMREFLASDYEAYAAAATEVQVISQPTTN